MHGVIKTSFSVAPDFSGFGVEIVMILTYYAMSTEKNLKITGKIYFLKGQYRYARYAPPKIPGIVFFSNPFCSIVFLFNYLFSIIPSFPDFGGWVLFNLKKNQD